MNRLIFASSTTAVLLILLGCSRASHEAEVSGTVTLDGKTIGPGTIVFAPTTADGKPATGAIESDGRYSLSTRQRTALAAGAYQVAISIRELPKDVNRGDRPPLGKLLIPEKYEDHTRSGLEYQVSPGRNTINIELVSR
jgi:hypothetical protein